MTPTPSAAPATERGAVLEALAACNLAEFNYRKEPWALDLFEELIKARKRFAEAVAEALAEEETDR